MDNLKSKLVFLKEFVREFEAMGAFCATSSFAGKAMTEAMVGKRAPMRVLEAGPGTGSVTDQILRRMIPGDELVCCEINPRLMAALKENISKHPLFPQFKYQISFFTGPVQELPSDKPFDLIVCAIPFLNLDIEIIQQIFGRFKELSHTKTTMTYYEYIAMRHLGKAVSRSRRERVKTLEPFMQNLWSRTDKMRKQVWLNMPPINVYRLRNIHAIDVTAAARAAAHAQAEEQASDPAMAA